VLDKTGSLPVSFPVQIIYRIVSYRTEETDRQTQMRISFLAGSITRSPSLHTVKYEILNE